MRSARRFGMGPAGQGFAGSLTLYGVLCTFMPIAPTGDALIRRCLTVQGVLCANVCGASAIAAVRYPGAGHHVAWVVGGGMGHGLDVACAVEGARIIITMPILSPGRPP